MKYALIGVGGFIDQQYPRRAQRLAVLFFHCSSSHSPLTGLLFVALSINVKHFRKQKHADAMQTARGAFGDFLYVLMIGIVFLVPLKAAFGFAIALIALGVSRLVGVIRLLIQPLRQNRYKHTLVSSIREFALPLVATVGLISVGIAIWLGYYNSIFTW